MLLEPRRSQQQEKILIIKQSQWNYLIIELVSFLKNSLSEVKAKQSDLLPLAALDSDFRKSFKAF